MPIKDSSGAPAPFLGYFDMALANNEVFEGYLSSDVDRIVQVWISYGRGYIGVVSAIRHDVWWRREISVKDATALLALCERPDGGFAEHVPSENDEIERKFLVEEAFRVEVTKSTEIHQGYLNSDPARTVRVRITDGQAEFTVKGIGSASGASRFEWECDLDLEIAQGMFDFCEPGVVHKIRHIVPTGDHIVQVDEMLDGNAGLVMGEIEFAYVGEDFVRPSWLGTEVTGDKRYYNAYLAKHPFKDWPEGE